MGILRQSFRSRTAASALMLLTFIWVFLWRFGDYGYSTWMDSIVIPSLKATNDSWDETFGAKIDEGNAGVEDRWRKERERKLDQDVEGMSEVKAVCQQPMAVGDDEKKRIARIAELELQVEKEMSQREQERKVWDKSTVLNGPPMERFRDNIKNDTYYLTAWSSAGFTNQFMGYVNMIYLATLTDRVPIVPPFAPDHHIDSSAGIVPFGDVFDLEHLSEQLRLPVLEWRDVKQVPKADDLDPYPFVPKSTEYPSEDLGCWSTRPAHETNPIRAEHVVYHLGLDVSYTRIPFATRFQLTRDPNEAHVNFPHLAALIYRSPGFSSSEKSHIAPSWIPFADPEREPDRYEELGVSPGGHHRRPEAHLSCFDTMYYMTSSAELFEWRFGFSPVWRTVGKWLRFSEKMKGLTAEYLDVLFGRAREDGADETPPFVAVHIRRGDFEWPCGKDMCLAPLSVYAEQVEEVKRELREKKGVEVEHVIVMSDEEDPEFWAGVKALGWLSVDHQAHQTLERFGQWFPPLIDIVIQSYASGFVGTEDSTFSLISQKRVIDWNGGFVRSVNARFGDWNP